MRKATDARPVLAGALVLALAAPLPAGPGAVELCAPGSGLPALWAVSPTAGMVHVRGATFTPGARDGYPDERPGGPVTVGDFWIDRTEVSNAQFAAFVAATGHRTTAERAGASAVFSPPGAPGGAWWHPVAGASWRHPEGPASDIARRMNHPVVHVSRDDARAYADWLGREVPTEAEWELAARGADREPRDARGPRANYWQGDFPGTNTREDGYLGTAPVGCFPANPRGIHDLIGNVWEWTAGAYAAWPARGDGNTARTEPEPLGVIKGGSFLCAPGHCVRFRAAARHAQEAGVAASHLGFRTVLRARRGR